LERRWQRASRRPLGKLQREARPTPCISRKLSCVCIYISFPNRSQLGIGGFFFFEIFLQHASAIKQVRLNRDTLGFFTHKQFSHNNSLNRPTSEADVPSVQRLVRLLAEEGRCPLEISNRQLAGPKADVRLYWTNTAASMLQRTRGTIVLPQCSYRCERRGNHPVAAATFDDMDGAFGRASTRLDCQLQAPIADGLVPLRIRQHSRRLALGHLTDLPRVTSATPNYVARGPATAATSRRTGFAGGKQRAIVSNLDSRAQAQIA